MERNAPNCLVTASRRLLAVCHVLRDSSFVSIGLVRKRQVGRLAEVEHHVLSNIVQGLHLEFALEGDSQKESDEYGLKAGKRRFASAERFRFPRLSG